MEEFAEVSMEQEFGNTEAAPVTEEDLPAEDHADEEAPVQETNEETQNETEVSEENAEHALTEEAAAVDSDGNESQEQAVPEIDPQVYAGWQELAKAHPEVVGKPLPDDIMKACVESGLPPLRVYESMMLVKQGEQIDALQQEIATLRQNSEAAQRAPVTAASFGGDAGYDPNDPFMKDFDSYYSGT